MPAARSGGRQRTYARRYAWGRPQRRSALGYHDGLADVLERRGAFGEARRLRGCCRVCEVRECPHCGDEAGSIRVVADCDVRGCAWCGRARALELREELGGALRRVADTLAARAPELLARAEGLAAKHAAAGDYWREQGRRAAARELDGRAMARVLFCEAAATAAASRAARARRAVHDLRGRARWSWKLVTISPRWNPRDAGEYKPARLRARAADAIARFERVWRAGLCGGDGAAAVLTIECSSHGHVHAHALVFGPWTSKSWLQRTAGCHVDVRRVQADPTDAETWGLQEALKYALKVPSVGNTAWIAGKRFTVPHVELAASWCLALRRFRTLRAFGLAVDCIAAERAADDTGDEAPGLTCWNCRAVLTEALATRECVQTIARDLGATRWEARLTVARAPPSA